jgi:hypothetical protein
LRRAGLWRPTIPGPREAMAIIRYSGSLDRTIRRASSELEGLKNMRIGGVSSRSIMRKQTHYLASPSSAPEPGEGPRLPLSADAKAQKQTHWWTSGSGVPRLSEGPEVPTSGKAESAKTNPISSMFTGNRHQRRRAKALATRRR